MRGDSIAALCVLSFLSGCSEFAERPLYRIRREGTLLRCVDPDFEESHSLDNGCVERECEWYCTGGGGLTVADVWILFRDCGEGWQEVRRELLPGLCDF